MNRIMTKSIAIVLLLSLVGSLCACGNTSNNEVTSSTERVDTTIESTTSETTTVETTIAQQESENVSEVPYADLSEQQWNSINVLNWLTVLSQEINSSKNSRLFLESVYNSLINDTYPNSVDVRTQAHMEDMLDNLDAFRMIEVKRERLSYIYEQNRAKAMKAAIPNPVALLSAVQSGDYLRMAISVIYMAVDSYTSYTEYTEEADLQYLKDGWELDDEQSKEVHQSRKQAFSYMLDMVRNNELPGDYALNEKSVENFVKWKNTSEDEIVRRIQWLESNQDTYKALGEYWLVLSKSYYDNGDYNKCIDAIHNYEKNKTRVFREDLEYAKALTYAIYSAREIYNDDKYIAFAKKYLPIIDENSKSADDWTIRYFISESYIDLFTKTEDKSYLQSAYKIQKDIVNILIDEQRKYNEQYINDIQLQSVDKNASKEEKKEVQNYNKMLEEQRKTELPPIYEPLYVNCDLLFAIAKELKVDDKEQKNIEQMIHGGGKLFYNQFIENRMYSSPKDNDAQIKKKEITFSDGKVILPVTLLSKDSVIKVTIKGKNGTKTYSDWIIDEVERKDKKVDNFKATYISKSAKDYKYSDGDVVELYIYEKSNDKAPAATIQFKSSIKTTLWVINSVSFSRI